MANLDGPLPLVTLTLTTDEIAMTSAALILLRRHWAQVNDPAADQVCMRIEALRNRLDGEVTEEQGKALLSELINELKRKPR